MKQVNFITNNINMFNFFVYVPAGSIYEKEGIRGISHLLEHMLMKHTKLYTNRELSKKLTQLGGISNAGTSKDITFYYIKTHIDNYKIAIKLMHDIINNPVFTKDELEREKKIVLEEFASFEDDTDSIINDLSNLTVLTKKNEYSYPIQGKKNDIKNITLNDLHKYFNNTYSKYTILINCDKKFLKEIKLEVNKYFKNKDIDLLSHSNTPKHVTETNNIGRVIIVKNDKLTQFNTVLSFITYPINMVKELIISHFIRFIISSAGFNSILFSEIREKRALVYSINSYHDDNRFIGIYKIEFASTNPNTSYIISIILSLLKNLSDDGVTSKQLQYFKTSFLNRTKYIFADESIRETWYGNNLFYNINTSKEEYIKIIKNITNDDIKEISKHIFNYKKMGIVSCGNYHNNNIEKEIIDIKNTYSSIS